MNCRSMLIAIAVVIPLSAARADEPLDISAKYQQIVADYQRVVASTQNIAARAAAGRLTRDAYRLLIQQAATADQSDADDLHALGQCHEAIDETDEAKALYAKSMAAKPQARTHLSLARISLRDDLKTADDHFAKAVELDPAYPDLPGFRLSLAAAYERERDWTGAIPYLESVLGYTKTLAERTPASTRLQLSHDAVQRQLDRTRRFAGLTGQAAPDLKAQQWAQGESIAIGELKGKVVLIDFCAMWAQPSRQRMELLKELHKKYAAQGLEIVSVTLDYQHKYDEAADQVTYEKDLKPEDERTGLAAFAKKHEIPWRVGVIGQETTAEYGVATLPHTVALDKQGNVSAIVLGGDNANEDLDAVVGKLVQ